MVIHFWEKEAVYDNWYNNVILNKVILYNFWHQFYLNFRQFYKKCLSDVNSGILSVVIVFCLYPTSCLTQFMYLLNIVYINLVDPNGAGVLVSSTAFCYRWKYCSMSEKYIKKMCSFCVTKLSQTYLVNTHIFGLLFPLFLQLPEKRF